MSDFNDCPDTEGNGLCPDIFPEPCPPATVFTVEGCQDFISVQLPPVQLYGQGRIVQLDVPLKAICPGKRVAVSVILTEIDGTGARLPRGIKHFVVPAQQGRRCRDLMLRCIRFSVPEAVNPACGDDNMCGTRNFEAQVIANYMDTDYASCCDENPDLL